MLEWFSLHPNRQSRRGVYNENCDKKKTSLASLKFRVSEVVHAL